MKNYIKTFIFIILLLLAVIAFFGGIILVKDWCEWNFLFIYQSYIPRVILICIALTLSILITKKIEGIKTFWKNILAKTFFAIIPFIAIYAPSEAVMRTILYKTTNEPFNIKTKVNKIEYLPRSTEMLLDYDGYLINIRWGRYSIGKNIDKKPDVKLLINVNVWLIQPGDSIIISGRKNIFGMSIDKLEKVEPGN